MVGDTPSAANLVKLSGNFLIATVIESLGEAIALIDKGGIDRHAYLDMLTARCSRRRCTRPTERSSRSNTSRRDSK